ncbi:unnamed protein product, partial [Adineta steineri]
MISLLRYVVYYPSTEEYLINNLKIFDSILILLNNYTLLDNILTATEYNSKTNLTDLAIFLKLKYANIHRVKLYAFMILAKILNKQDIQNLDNIDILTT